MHYRVWMIVAALSAGVLVMAACGPAATAPPGSGLGPETGQPLPVEDPLYEWNQLLSRDSIRPIYDPEFVSADEANYSDDELVMGVEIDGQAKAYPVSVLNSREMVNDELAGKPILVTW